MAAVYLRIQKTALASTRVLIFDSLPRLYASGPTSRTVAPSVARF